METDNNTESIPLPKPQSRLRRNLLKLGASLFGIAATKAILPNETAYAESPPPAPNRPNPDKEKIQAELIPRDELQRKYHISILDLPDVPNYVKLNFRRSATEEPFFQQQEKEKTSCYIVLLDGPYIDPEFLSADQRERLPDEAVDKLERACDDFIRERKKDYERTKRTKMNRYKEDLEFLKKQVEEGKMNRERYEVEVQDLNLKYLEPSREAILKTARGVNLSPEIDHTEGRYIFLPARNVQDTVIQSGDEKIVYEEPEERHGFPRPYQSFPSPSRFSTNPAEPMYPMWGGNTPSTNLRHEIKHLEGWKHPYTDYQVLNDIQKAYSHLQEGDDSKYWVVWETIDGLTVSQKEEGVKSA